MQPQRRSTFRHGLQPAHSPFLSGKDRQGSLLETQRAYRQIDAQHASNSTSAGRLKSQCNQEKHG